MASNSKYVFFSGSNFLDLDLDYPAISLDGQSIQITGTGDIDRVFVRPGTSVDFVQSGGGADKLYLAGSLASYSYSVEGTILVVTRGAGATLESARISGNSTDVLVFGDGTVTASSLRDYAQSIAPVAPGSPVPAPLAVPTPAGETSAAPVLPASYASTAKFIAYTATTFAPVDPGIAVTLVGSPDVDKVYVKEGSAIVATSLGASSRDQIFFTGTWSDYAKSTAGTNLLFERDINGHHESVLLSQKNALTANVLVFADGAAGSYTAGVAIRQAVAAGTPIPAISTLSDYDSATFTPGTAPHLPVLSLAALPAQDAFVNAAEAGVTVEVAYGNMHSGDTIQLKNGAANVGAVHTVSGSEANAGKASINVTKAALGNTDGVKHLVANVTNTGGITASGELLITVDTAAPVAPVLTAAHAALNAGLATASAGAVTVLAEADSAVQVVFTAGLHSVAKALTGTGAAQAVVLNAADLATLGDGPISVQALATDHAANVGPAGSASFVLDTIAPLAPMLSAPAAYLNAAGAAAVSGAVTVSAEAGSTVTVSFARNSAIVVKTFVASGVNQSVSLTAADVAVLGDGAIAVTASTADAATNASVSSTASFVLDTAAPASPIISAIAGDDVVNAAEQGAVLTGTTESGSTVALHFGTGTVAATVSDTVWSYHLQPADVARLGQGAVVVQAVSTDRANNVSATASRSITIDTVAPHVTSIDRGTTANVDLNGNTNSNGTLDLVVGFDDPAVVGATTASNWVATLNGTPIIGAVTGVTSLGGGQFRIAIDASRVGAADGLLTVALAAVNTVADAAANGAIVSVVSSLAHGYTIDHVNQSPTFATASLALSVAENTAASTVLFTGGATDPDLTAPNNVLTYSLAGVDAGLFDINTATGGVSFKASPNFESSAHGAHYQLMTIATDGGGRSALQSVSVDVLDVNEAPVVGTVLGTQVAGVGHAFGFVVPAGAFVDPDGVASGANHTLTYAATLAGGAALPSWLHFDAATATFSGLPVAGHLDVTVTATDGGATPLSVSQTFGIDAFSAVNLSSSLSGVTNLDVTSPIVLSATEAVTAVAGKYVHIVDAGGSSGAMGYDGEATVHTQDILVTDSSQVQIVANHIVIDPRFDLDLSSNYTITVDDGAFTGIASHLSSVAVGSAAIQFATVTPGGGTGSNVASAAASQAMDTATGALHSSYSWWSVEGVGSTSIKSDADLSTGHIAMVFKDWNVAGGDLAAGTNGVGVKQAFWVNASRFGSDDLLYIDDQSNNPLQANLIALTDVNHNGSQPVRLAFDPAPAIGVEGQGWLDIGLDGNSQVFNSIASWQSLLAITTSPVVSG